MMFEMLLGLSLLSIMGLIAAFYMAWNIGANDLANSMGDVVGARALNLRQVVILAGIMNFLGAVIYGSRVTETVGKGIVPITDIDPYLAALGALSALIAAGLWITTATYFNLPVSTSHSIVGAMLGFGLVSAFRGTIGLNDIAWVVLLKVVLSWILSPVSGMFLGFIIFSAIRRTFIERAESIASLEGIFRYLLICSSCYQAFSFGSNDVANAIGPVSVVMGFVGTVIPIWLLVLGGIGMVIGLSTWGYKVVYTIGEKITDLTPTRGFSADVACATTVIACSYLGLPVSTTHVLVGSTIGVGLARGLEAVNLNVIRNIVYSWLLTVPVAMIISMIIYLGIIEVVI
ncbi:MAG: anion permease [Halobacteriota archaeon]|nr:anion permease [Halobacteriota archaeon]